MKEREVKVVFRRGSLLLKLSVLAVVSLSLVALLVVWIYKQQAKQDYEELRDQAIALEQSNSRLEKAIQSLGTVQGIFQIAKEELGLVDPDTIIIEPVQ